MSLDDHKEAAFAWVDDQRDTLSQWPAQIWDFHEPAWREYRSSAW